MPVPYRKEYMHFLKLTIVIFAPQLNKLYELSHKNYRVISNGTMMIFMAKNIWQYNNKK